MFFITCNIHACSVCMDHIGHQSIVFNLQSRISHPLCFQWQPLPLKKLSSLHCLDCPSLLLTFHNMSILLASLSEYNFKSNEKKKDRKITDDKNVCFHVFDNNQKLLENIISCARFTLFEKNKIYY